jgi:hypothetical protein
LEGFEERWVGLAQQGPELIGDLLAVPDGILLGAGQDSDRLHEFGVGRQGPVRGSIDAQDVRQQLGVDPVRFRTGDAVTLAIARHGQGIDGVDPATRASRAGDDQPSWRLDRDRDLLVLRIPTLRQQVEQQAIPGGIISDPASGQHGSGLVHQGDVVVLLSPVDPTAHRHSEPSRSGVMSRRSTLAL